MPSKIQVVIEASTQDLTAKMALAKAALADFRREEAKQSAAINTAMKGEGASAEQYAALEATSRASADAKNALAGYSSEMKHAAEASGEMGLATAGTTREFIVLGHEMLQGRFSRIPGSIMVVSERMGSLHKIIAGITPTMYATAAGALALGAALAEMAIQAFRSQEAFTAANRAFQFAGLTESEQQIHQWTDAVREMPGVTAEAPIPTLPYRGFLKSGAASSAARIVPTPR